MDPVRAAAIFEARDAVRANLLGMFDMVAQVVVDLLCVVTPAPRVDRAKRPASASPVDGGRPKRAKTGG